MAWQSFTSKRGLLFFALAMGVVTIGLAVFWGLKLQKFHGIRREIARVERDLAAGQKLWRQFPPLGPEEKRDLQEAQERLLRKLPKDKEIPLLLQEISRLALEYSLSDVSFKTDRAAPGSASVVAATAAAKKADGAGDSKPIASFPMRLAFAGDYREIAYFLEALQDLPRLVRIQSLRMERGVPLVVVEILLRAYYTKKDLGVVGK